VIISFDPAKRASNLAKHGLDLADGAQVLEGHCLDRLDDRRDYGEERWMSIGLLHGEIVVCAWADWGEDEVRLISLRKATANEQKEYLRYVIG
jgi:uncharacterized DUF497 family protein